MLVYLYKFLLVLFYLFLAVSLLSTTIGIPGNWILFAAALIFALASHFTKITWGYLFVCLALAVVGELMESFLGTVVVARKGGGKYGIIGTFIGGFMGVILGAPFLTPFGSILFGFLGAFSGAVAGEYIAYKNLDAAMRIGFWAFMGRFAAVFIKICLGCVIFWIIVIRTW